MKNINQLQEVCNHHFKKVGNISKKNAEWECIFCGKKSIGRKGKSKRRKDN